MDLIKIVPADPGDAESIVKVHYQAVHVTSKPYYSEEIVKTWANPSHEEKIEKIADAISRDDTLVLVAKEHSNIVAFGIVNFDKNYLGAVYVHPSWGRKNIGSRILSRLEKAARIRGLKELRLEASLNSRKFYLDNGWTFVKDDLFEIRPGTKMACIKMIKSLK